MALDPFRFAHRLRVRWAETDMQGVVFNGHYLTFFDVAFTEYWRTTGLPDFVAQARSGFEMFARKSTVEYHAPARFDDVLDIHVRVGRIGRSSMQVLFEIHRFEPGPTKHLVSGELIYVYVDTGARTSSEIAAHWRARLESIEPLLTVS